MVRRDAAPDVEVQRHGVGHTLRAWAWAALTRYVEDGTIEIDNDPIERDAPIALGRKNWLFAESDTCGTRAAAIASIISNAKLNGLNPKPTCDTSLTDRPAFGGSCYPAGAGCPL